MNIHQDNSNLVTNALIKHFRLKLITRNGKKCITVPFYNTCGKLTVRCELEEAEQTGLMPGLRSEPIIYHSERIPPARNHLLLTFGIRSVWRIWQLWYPDVVGLLGQCDTALTKWVDQAVKQNGTLWVLTDGNRPAIARGGRIARLLGGHRCIRQLAKPSVKIADMEFNDFQQLFSHA